VLGGVIVGEPIAIVAASSRDIAIYFFQFQ